MAFNPLVAFPMEEGAVSLTAIGAMVDGRTTKVRNIMLCLFVEYKNALI